jgi:hypothetical protein
MTRFGDLLGGKKVEEVVGSPIVEEDTTNYEAVIEEEMEEDLAPSSVEDPVDPEPSSMNGGYYIPSASGTSPLEAG